VPVNVLFVCLGNICRSPTAHALFQARVNKEGLAGLITVDSAGTGDWHAGLPPDKRAQHTAIEHGYDMGHLRARVVTAKDFSTFDYILAMDKHNLQYLQEMNPTSFQGVLGLFLTESGICRGENEVPDPYYGDERHFHHVIELIEAAVEGLLSRIKKDHQL
jgi:protein-tyrosine phosphatase